MSSQSDALKIDIVVNNMTNANSSHTSCNAVVFFWENGTLEKYYVMVKIGFMLGNIWSINLNTVLF